MTIIEQTKVFAKENNSKLIECNHDSAPKAFDEIIDAIQTKKYGEVSEVIFGNYDPSNKNDILTAKVKTTDGKTPLVIIFDAKGEALDIVTSLQIFCGHENTWSIGFEH